MTNESAQSEMRSEFYDPPLLTGSLVHLAPLRTDHLSGLTAAVQDGELWKLWYTSVPEPEKMEEEIARRLALQNAGSMMPFTVVEQTTGRIVGMTTFMHMDRANRRVEIGSTWYARSVQRTGLNTEAKWLLLTHAFERMLCIAVEFRTHFFNQESRRAIERLGGWAQSWMGSCGTIPLRGMEPCATPVSTAFWLRSGRPCADTSSGKWRNRGDEEASGGRFLRRPAD